MRIKGYVSWADVHDNHGIIRDFNENRWYFNSWSFPETHYLVTGKCKKSGQEKTIQTRNYPGLFLDYKIIHDDKFLSLGRHAPVSFERFEDYRGLWALKVEVEDTPERRKELEIHFENQRYETLEKMLNDLADERDLEDNKFFWWSGFYFERMMKND